MSADTVEIRGVWTRGEDPKELVLSDGSRLALEPDDQAGGKLAWRRSHGRDETEGSVSAADARALAGEEFSGYVGVRTRSEAEWLRAVADWCRGEATRLEGELQGARA